MSVITRFAPSPTGYLHIGGARTALFNYLFAKNKGGKFLLRIEDTDKERSTAAAIDAILQGLDWLGLNHDVNYILQSNNSARHKEVAEKLLEKNQAYLCYTSAEELEDLRKDAESRKEVFRFKSPWRDKFQSQSSTVKPVIRIKAPLNGEMVINDLVQGEIKVQNSELDDLIMLRSDGTPTYMLAVVVDDHDMEVSHVIRGDDHLTNAFRQKVIYQAMNWKVPEFAHIPLIHGADGAKLSKRHGATSVIEYKDMGYLPESMRNYLLRLGWSHGDMEIISDNEAINLFNLEKIGKSPSRFDFTKLKSVNKHYIKEKNEEELLNLCSKFFDREIVTSEKERLLKAIKFVKERSDLVSDLAKSLEIYFDNFTGNFDDSSSKLIAEKKTLVADLALLLRNLNDWSHDGVKNAFNDFATEKSLKIKDFGPLLRVILTYSSASAGGIFDVVEILGKAEVLRRIENVLWLYEL
ncbi:MAG: glutamate--tRNA ligase [Pelagibacterales bacterium]|nr:glutamate--tRNA ligase [Pelagibacterales bacterium]